MVGSEGPWQGGAEAMTIGCDQNKGSAAALQPCLKM